MGECPLFAISNFTSNWKFSSSNTHTHSLSYTHTHTHPHTLSFTHAAGAIDLVRFFRRSISLTRLPGPTWTTTTTPSPSEKRERRFGIHPLNRRHRHSNCQEPRRQNTVKIFLKRILNLFLCFRLSLCLSFSFSSHCQF